MEGLRHALIVESVRHGLEHLAFARCDSRDGDLGSTLFLAQSNGIAQEFDRFLRGQKGLARAETSQRADHLIDRGCVQQDARRPSFDRPGCFASIRGRCQNQRRAARAGAM